MLKFFERGNLCHIVLDSPLVLDDTQMLSTLLKREYSSVQLEFGRVYSVGSDIVEILYEFVFVQNINLSITTHKSRLNRYLGGLGFKTQFDSLISQDVVKLSEVEVVLVGGSADSSSKIMEMVKNITLKHLTFIIVQHVQTDSIAMFDEILQRESRYRVSYAQDGEKIEKEHIYIAPSAHHLLVKDARFYLDDSQKYNYAKPSVSLSYESFSTYYKEKLLVIHECGFASDGVDKMQDLKMHNSKLIIQNIDECEAKPMVKNALNLHIEDYVFSLKDMILYMQIIDNETTKEAWIDFLLDEIDKRYNYDFRLYHRDMIHRRVNIFMLKHNIKNIKDTIGLILFNRSAFRAFFLEVSINVTELFRNPESFKLMSDLFKKSYHHAHSIKLWSAGCSSGQEVYSLAILLDSLKLLEKSIIYATDFNSVVLEEAKNGIYPSKLCSMAKENFEKVGLQTDLSEYVTKNSNYMMFNEKIKEKILFFQHNLVEDSSFNEFDIIICKNVIIYFDDNLQERVFQLLYDSLKFGGYLVLGESEAVVEKFAHKFESYSVEFKIFKKVM